MPIHVERTVLLPAKPETAFRFIANFANLPHWDPGVARASCISAGPLGVGSRFDVVAKFLGADVPMEYVVQRWEPNHRVVLEGKARTMDAVDDISFSEAPTGTVVTYRATFLLQGTTRFARPVMARVMEVVADRAIAGLVSAFSERRFETVGSDGTAQP